MTQLRRSLRVIGVTGALLFLSLIIGLLHRQTTGQASRLKSGVDFLHDAYSRSRPLQVMISGFPYAPHPSSGTTSGQDRNTAEKEERAERILLDAAVQDGSAESHHALGQLYLVRAQFDKASREFERAAEKGSQAAELWSDLGACYLEMGRLEHSQGKPDRGLEHAAKALEQFERALDLVPGCRPALFNRALAAMERTVRRVDGRTLTARLPDQARLDRISKGGIVLWLNLASHVQPTRRSVGSLHILWRFLWSTPKDRPGSAAPTQTGGTITRSLCSDEDPDSLLLG